MPGLRERYATEVVPALREALGCRNVMQVPRLVKVVINMGVGSGVDRDGLQALSRDLARLAGQKPVETRARRSISNFKVRAGMPVGLKVTLRGGRMFDFLERLIHATLPRVRDFRGVSDRGFDGRGSFSMGLQEQTVFPEIDPDEVKLTQGMDITIVTTARTDEEGRELLRRLGMPLAHG